MNPNTTLHILTRVSSDTQKEDGYGLENQLQSGISVAEKIGFTYKHWDEGSVSSSKNTLRHRPVMTNVLGEVENGNIKHLYVFAYDRLWRSDEVFSQYKLTLFKGGVNLYTGRNINPIDLSDPFERTMLNVMSSFAILDNELRTERFRLGRIAAVLKGGWKGGPPPYGYKLLEKRLVVDDFEAEQVSLIFNLYLEGKGYDEIRNTLLSRGVLTRRGHTIWTNASLSNIIKTNTHYDGYWYFQDKVTEESHRVECPRIVSSKLYQEVQDLVKKRSYNSKHQRHLTEGGRIKPSNQKNTYLLQDLMTCGLCDSPYRVQTQRSKSKKDFGYYFCSNKPSINRKSQKTFDKIPCSVNKSIKTQILDDMVWKSLVDVISQSNLYREQIKLDTLGVNTSYSSSKRDEGKKNQKIKRLQTQEKQILEELVKVEVEKRLSTDVDVEKHTVIINRMEEVLRKVKSDIEVLQAEVDKGKTDRKWIDWVKTFDKHLKTLNDNDLTIEEQRDVVKGLIEQVVVTQHEDDEEVQIEIHFNLPIVNDELVWKNPENKDLGYELVDGLNTYTTSTSHTKKNFN